MRIGCVLLTMSQKQSGVLFWFRVPIAIHLQSPNAKFYKVV